FNTIIEYCLLDIRCPLPDLFEQQKDYHGDYANAYRIFQITLSNNLAKLHVIQPSEVHIGGYLHSLNLLSPTLVALSIEEVAELISTPLRALQLLRGYLSRLARTELAVHDSLLELANTSTSFSPSDNHQAKRVGGPLTARLIPIKVGGRRLTGPGRLFGGSTRKARIWADTVDASVSGGANSAPSEETSSGQLNKAFNTTVAAIITAASSFSSSSSVTASAGHSRDQRTTLLRGSSTHSKLQTDATQVGLQDQQSVWPECVESQVSGLIRELTAAALERSTRARLRGQFHARVSSAQLDLIVNCLERLRAAYLDYEAEIKTKKKQVSLKNVTNSLFI
ncbi:unnamed protein product, partial [Protopolystoma xenopodis]